MCRSGEHESREGEAGFTLVEVLVALAITAVSLAAIGSLVATSVRTTRSIDQRLALIETAQRIMAELPPSGLGSGAGTVSGHRWRLDVAPFSDDFADVTPQPPWRPQAIIVNVRSPSGRTLRIDTVRLRRTSGGQK